MEEVEEEEEETGAVAQPVLAVAPVCRQPTPSKAIPERDYFVSFRRRGTNGKSLLTNITTERKKHKFLGHGILTHFISL